MSETPALDEEVMTALTPVLTTAASIAEASLRAHREELARQEARDLNAAEQYRARLAGMREAEVGALARVRDERWWEQATDADVADAYRTARTWAPEDERAAEAASLIETRQAERERAVAERAEAERTRQEVPSPEQQAAEAIATVSLDVAAESAAETEAERAQAESDRAAAEATAADATAEAEAVGETVPEYDSPARRSGMERELVNAGVSRDAAAARVIADTGFGTAMTVIAGSAHKKQSRPRARTREAERTLER